MLSPTIPVFMVVRMQRFAPSELFREHAGYGFLPGFIENIRGSFVGRLKDLTGVSFRGNFGGARIPTEA